MSVKSKTIKTSEEPDSARISDKGSQINSKRERVDSDGNVKPISDLGKS